MSCTCSMPDAGAAATNHERDCDATLKLTDGKPAGGDSAAAEEETELYRLAREALALALDPGTRFRVIDVQP